MKNLIRLIHNKHLDSDERLTKKAILNKPTNEDVKKILENIIEEIEPKNSGILQYFFTNMYKKEIYYGKHSLCLVVSPVYEKVRYNLKAGVDFWANQGKDPIKIFGLTLWKLSEDSKYLYPYGAWGKEGIHINYYLLYKRVITKKNHPDKCFAPQILNTPLLL